MDIKKVTAWLLGSVIATVAIYASAILWMTWPITELSVNKSGVFGDSFGLLTALFSGLAFGGIIITILLQRDELKLQREELKLQREELEKTREELRKSAVAQLEQVNILNQTAKISGLNTLISAYGAMTDQAGSGRDRMYAVERRIALVTEMEKLLENDD